MQRFCEGEGFGVVWLHTLKLVVTYMAMKLGAYKRTVIIAEM